MPKIALFVVLLLAFNTGFGCELTTDESFLQASKQASSVFTVSIDQRADGKAVLATSIEVFKGTVEVNDTMSVNDESGLLAVGAYYLLLLDASGNCTHAAIAESEHGTDSYVLVEVTNYFSQ